MTPARPFRRDTRFFRNGCAFSQAAQLARLKMIKVLCDESYHDTGTSTR